MINQLLSKLKFPLIIDGGLSNVLEAKGCNLNNELWSAHIISKNPEAIIQAHIDYLEAGAQCITTSSYQASVPGFMKLGYSRAESENLILQSIKLAEKAIEQFNKKSKPIIAASIGPYGAFLANGSEYNGNYGVSDETLYNFHHDRIKLLENTTCDIFAIETIPSFQEAKVLSDILEQTNKLAWISFSCKDESHLNDGTPIKKAATLFKNHPNVFAIGANCTAPIHISSIITNLKTVIGDKKVIVYPNSGASYNAKSKIWIENSNPQSFSTMAKEWIGLGADIIGGCCLIGPDHIKSIRNTNEGI